MNEKQTDNPSKAQDCGSDVHALVRPGTPSTYFFIIGWTILGILCGIYGNDIAAIWTIVILVSIMSDETSKELIATQRSYIADLERLLEQEQRTEA